MNSDEIRTLDDLISRTESNIVAIQSFGKSFLCVVLNEWRYATRHIVNAMSSEGQSEDFRKAECHLRRAYYDSCDVLIDCLLQRIADYNDVYRGYSGIVAQIVSDFPSHMENVRAAKDAHRQARTAPPEARDGVYDSLSEHVVRLTDFMNALESTENLWRDDVRKQKSRDRQPIIWALVGICVSIVLAIIFH